jgi:hypothetical protein
VLGVRCALKFDFIVLKNEPEMIESRAIVVEQAIMRQVVNKRKFARKG